MRSAHWPRASTARNSRTFRSTRNIPGTNLLDFRQRTRLSGFRRPQLRDKFFFNGHFSHSESAARQSGPMRSRVWFARARSSTSRTCSDRLPLESSPFPESNGSARVRETRSHGRGIPLDERSSPERASDRQCLVGRKRDRWVFFFPRHTGRFRGPARISIFGDSTRCWKKKKKLKSKKVRRKKGREKNRFEGAVESARSGARPHADDGIYYGLYVFQGYQSGSSLPRFVFCIKHVKSPPPQLSSPLLIVVVIPSNTRLARTTRSSHQLRNHEVSRFHDTVDL